MKMSNKIGFVETPIEIASLMTKLSNVKKDSLILDTGSGKGIFLQALKNQNFTNVIGIEIDKELHTYCKNIFKEYKIIMGDYLTYNFNEKFDLIIGNPPYVHFNQLPFNISSIVKKITKTGESDIYYAFIIKSILLLKDGGELIYIVPYHFFYNTYAKLVRETILKFGKLEIIIDLDETRLFSKKSPEIIIFKFKKGKYDLKNEKIEVITIKTRKTNNSEITKKAIEALRNKTSNKLFNYNKITHYSDSESWSSFTFHIPDFPSVRLKDIAKVGVGLVSGFDEAFIIRNEENVESEFNDIEMNYIKRFVKGKYCKRFIVNGFTRYIVIDDSISSEEELATKCPNIYKKILPFKNKMLKRYLPKRKKWFHWQALRNYNFLQLNLNEKRIYVPTLDRYPYNRFSIGDKYLLPSGDILFIQPNNKDDLYFLVGYLNSSFFRKYYLVKGGKRGGRISFTQRLVGNVEIPLFSSDNKKKITSITKEIILNLENKKNITNLEKELDYFIYSLIEKQNFMSNLSKNSKKIILKKRDSYKGNHKNILLSSQ